MCPSEDTILIEQIKVKMRRKVLKTLNILLTGKKNDASDA